MFKTNSGAIPTKILSSRPGAGATAGGAPLQSVVGGPPSLAPQSLAAVGGGSATPSMMSTSSLAGVTAASATAGSATSDPNAAANLEKLYLNVRDLIDSEKREAALLTLSKQREEFPDLAPILWHSVGTIAALLQEIVSIYPLLQSSDALTPKASNRCCNALALLQCVASHQETRVHFLNAHIPLFLYPFLNTTHANRPFDFLRLTSLGVIGALVKVLSCYLFSFSSCAILIHDACDQMEDPDVISFLLQTEIIPLCLRIMETGNELLRTVATFIVQKILQDDAGLSYICATPDRFYAVSGVLSLMVDNLKKQPSMRLLKHIVHCYHRLSQNSKAREALKKCFPPALSDDTFGSLIDDDQTTKTWLEGLKYNLGSV
eukprot:TRINITY_DN8388_c0_g1_i3.p2 TRINITY_DN8388_c0_g1~~TRINITY_DN8388_c0_g1_i3.p2  ORF type:complete len:376 (-),score=94.48 TRINITY_DN8388_c0_g1_i3:2754-3881(-)